MQEVRGLWCSEVMPRAALCCAAPTRVPNALPESAAAPLPALAHATAGGCDLHLWRAVVVAFCFDRYAGGSCKNGSATVGLCHAPMAVGIGAPLLSATLVMQSPLRLHSPWPTLRTSAEWERPLQSAHVSWSFSAFLDGRHCMARLPSRKCCLVIEACPPASIFQPLQLLSPWPMPALSSMLRAPTTASMPAGTASKRCMQHGLRLASTRR